MGLRSAVVFGTALLLLGVGVGTAWFGPGVSADPGTLNSHQLANQCPAGDPCDRFCFYAVCTACTQCCNWITTYCDSTCPGMCPPPPGSPPGTPDVPCQVPCRVPCGGYCVYYDCSPCTGFEWHLRGEAGQSADDDNDDLRISDFELPNTDSAVIFGTGNYPGQHCYNEDRTNAPAPTVAPVGVGGTVVARDLGGVKPAEYLLGVPLPPALVVTGGELGAAHLADVTETAYQQMTLTHNGGGGLMFRYWPYSGFVPGVVEVPFRLLGAGAQAMPANAIGVYSFQLGYLGSEGDPERLSNVVHEYVGYRYNPLPPHYPPLTTTLSSAAVIPAPTPLSPLPTALPGETQLVRPVTPQVTTVVEEGTDGRVRVTLAGGFSGRLEQRHFAHSGLYPLGDDVPWMEQSVSGGQFLVVGLSYPTRWAFEVRGVVQAPVPGSPGNTMDIYGPGSAVQTVMVWGDALAGVGP